MKITPAIKGIISAVLMIAVILVIFYSRATANNAIQYLVYIFYGLGIVWTIVAYRQSPANTGKFGELFGQGFRCFIVVTLLMALFYGLFNYFHPEFAEETAVAYKAHLLEQVTKKEILPTQVESELATFKKQYTLKLVSGAIFGYLIIGAAVTAAVSAASMKRK